VKVFKLPDITQCATKSGFRSWRTALKTYTDKAFLPENYGFLGSGEFFWRQGVACFKQTDPTRYECGLSSGILQETLQESGLETVPFRIDIKTLPFECRNPSEDDFGRLSHIFLAGKINEDEYHFGVTPLDRYVLGVYPTAKSDNSHSAILLEGETNVAPKLPEQGDLFPFWDTSGVMFIPMEWFMVSKVLVYLYAGFYLEKTDMSALFMVESIRFENNYSYPRTTSFSTRVDWEEVRAMQRELSRFGSFNIRNATNINDPFVDSVIKERAQRLLGKMLLSIPSEMG